ncbi:O-antigen ligase family protein [Aureimonas leprariae]|uniref:O-antigen ligase-related domain-containing protein n=1 Tax=Plantimonas leprariae TaxID=2615207 RepID=A0A7V7PNU3_9HYPH|nr:O-antigen ligase family protein [Aureimonas leprariae]KAB0679561.1 hypothetical protein F6X38_12105 [Aureimonas leprariae]
MRRRSVPASGLDLLPLGQAGRQRGYRERIRALAHPGRAALGHRNRLSNFAFFVAAAMGGSAATVVAVVLAGWALISLLFRRFVWRFERSDLPVVLSTLFFFLAIAGSDVFHGFEAGEPARAARHVGERLLFLLPLLLIPRMRCSRFPDTLPPAFLGAALGGTLLLPICLLSPGLANGRVDGFSGNEGPFSIAALLAAGWSLLALREGAGRLQRALAVAGMLGGALAVVASGMRGAWPALPLVLFVALVARRRAIAALWRGTSPLLRVALAAAGGAILAGAAFLLAAPLVLRVRMLVGDLSLIAADVDFGTSTSLRRDMYEAATQAIAARPWFGYGESGLWRAIKPYLDTNAFAGFSYTHLHDVFLTVGVIAGFVGLAALVALVAAPLWTAWAARRTEGGNSRLAAAAILTLAFLVPGLTNIMFLHDILDSIWVFAASLVAASVPARREASP